MWNLRIRIVSLPLALASAALAFVLAPRAASAASFTPEAEAPIRAALAAIDANDRVKFVKSFTAGATILDEISPFRFGDAGAWFDRLATVNRDNGIAHERTQAGPTQHASVEGNDAYATLPVRIDYEQRGRAVVENGTWTFALRKVASAWQISAASFAPAQDR